MMSLQDRILMVVRGSEAPLSSREVGHVLGLTANAVSSPLSKLCAYGKLELVRIEKFSGKRGANNLRYYRPKIAKETAA